MSIPPSAIPSIPPPPIEPEAAWVRLGITITTITTPIFCLAEAALGGMARAQASSGAARPTDLQSLIAMTDASGVDPNLMVAGFLSDCLFYASLIFGAVCFVSRVSNRGWKSISVPAFIQGIAAIFHWF